MEEKHLLVSTPQAISIETAKVSVTTEREKVTDWEQKTALAFSPSSGPLGGDATFDARKEHALLIRPSDDKLLCYKQQHQNNAQQQCIKQMNTSSEPAAP